MSTQEEHIRKQLLKATNLLAKFKDLPDSEKEKLRTIRRFNLIATLLQLNGTPIAPMQLQALFEGRVPDINFATLIITLNLSSALSYIEYLVDARVIFTENQLLYLHFILSQSNLPAYKRGHYSTTIKQEGSQYLFSADVSLSNKIQNLLNSSRGLTTPLVLIPKITQGLYNLAPFEDYNLLISQLIMYYYLLKFGGTSIFLNVDRGIYINSLTSSTKEIDNSSYLNLFLDIFVTNMEDIVHGEGVC